MSTCAVCGDEVCEGLVVCAGLSPCYAAYERWRFEQRAAESAVVRERRRPWSWQRLLALYLAAILFALLVGVGSARCDELWPAHLRTPSTCRTDGGTELRLPPGWFEPEAEWQALDARLRAAEDGVTELRAENASLRQSVRGQVIWIGAALVVGALTGAGVVLYLEHR